MATRKLSRANKTKPDPDPDPKPKPLTPAGEKWRAAWMRRRNQYLLEKMQASRYGDSESSDVSPTPRRG